MNLLEKEIQRIRELVKKSDEVLEWMPNCSEKTREFYHNGNIHFELRKLTQMSNDHGGIYCSRCGEKFKFARDRTIHTLDNHGK